MQLSDLLGRRVGVWGYGREGRAAVRALRSVGVHHPQVVTDDPLDDPQSQTELQVLGLTPAHGSEGQRLLHTCDVVIHSPGVSIYRPEVEALRQASVEVTSGTNLWFAEMAARADNAPLVIGVTGTKGKSTTTSLIGHLLALQGRHVEVAGNIGRPLLDLLELNPQPGLVVAELSSHQCSDIVYSPSIAVVTNLYREHLDWHLTEEQYYTDKLNLLHHRADLTAVLNAENQELVGRSTGLTTIRWFGAGGRFHVDGETIKEGNDVLYRASDISLRGRHNRLNICAALTALAAAGANPTDCAEGLRTFRPLPHRLQEVAKVGGRTYVDDSISTTPEAARAALEALDGVPVTILLGGFDRRQEYSGLVADVCARPSVCAVVTLPDNGERIGQELREASAPCAVLNASSLDEAVRVATEVTPPGGTVLLSPAAPSFGHFRNFEERGDAFARAALAL